MKTTSLSATLRDEKGFTLNDYTKMMNRYEQKIAFYNNKYDFEIETKGTAAEIKNYRFYQRSWELAKPLRDKLKTQIFNQANNK